MSHLPHPIIGFAGTGAYTRAIKCSRCEPPRVHTLPDGSLVGVGLTRMNFVDGFDRIDTDLHGARSTRAKLSDFERQGGARNWLELTTVERARRDNRLKG